MGRLNSKIAVITGGGSGFGAGIAEKFIAEGARVIIADIDLTAATQIADNLNAAHGHPDPNSNRAAKRYPAMACAVDVSDGDSMANMIKTATQTYGAIDIMVNNAGVTHLPQAMEDVAETDFDQVLAVNVKSVYLGARLLVPQMKARGSGVFLNIASTAGISPRPNLNWYNASKGWMITATKAMAVELAPHGIRVNAINPVAGETPLLKSFMGEDTPEMRAKFLSSIPIGRFSTPVDIANAACFLCGDEASMITGVALEVDGGRCI